jgi:hypothetical protein
LIKDLDIFEVISKIKEFKALIENISKRKIKILSSDNGGEYTLQELVNFCKDVGMKIPNKTVLLNRRTKPCWKL